MNNLRLTVLLFTTLSVCCHGNASPTRFSYNAIAASGSTCASAGYTNGCCVSEHNDCYVPGGACCCDADCYEHRDCCSDISDIQCFNPRSCQSRGLSPGCCSFASSSCYVPEGTCYCDPTCHSNGDCCSDVTLTSCPAQTQRVYMSPRVDSIRAQRARSMRARQRPSEASERAGNAGMYREALANRAQNRRGYIDNNN